MFWPWQTLCPFPDGLVFTVFNDLIYFPKLCYFLVRNPEGRIKLYSKGADTILFEKLHPSNEDLQSLTSDHLSVSASRQFSTRTLLHPNG